MTTTYPGIDYGFGSSNVTDDGKYRFGVIASRDLACWLDDELTPEYWHGCPSCGTEIDEDSYTEGEPCPHCGAAIAIGEQWSESPIGYHVDLDGVYATIDSDGQLFVVRSPYYTHAQFCSPCAPGAGYLLKPCENGPKTLCFGHDWFESGRAPYPVYSVASEELVEPAV